MIFSFLLPFSSLSYLDFVHVDSSKEFCFRLKVRKLFQWFTWSSSQRPNVRLLLEEAPDHWPPLKKVNFWFMTFVCHSAVGQGQHLRRKHWCSECVIHTDLGWGEDAGQVLYGEKACRHGGCVLKILHYGNFN